MSSPVGFHRSSRYRPRRHRPRHPLPQELVPLKKNVKATQIWILLVTHTWMDLSVSSSFGCRDLHFSSPIVPTSEGVHTPNGYSLRDIYYSSARRKTPALEGKTLTQSSDPYSSSYIPTFFPTLHHCSKSDTAKSQRHLANPHQQKLT
jgi:hypothetical protein